MDEFITPDRIANSIMQDTNDSKYYLLIEGVKDLNVYPQFFNKELIEPKVTFGKYKMRDVWEILEGRGFTDKIAIRDADFIRVRGNYQEDFHPNFFITDTHDSEGMIVKTPTFEKVLEQMLGLERKQTLMEKFPNLKCHIKDLAYKVGCLKLANKLDRLGLVFKPQKANGKKLDFTKFVDVKSFTFIDDTALIQTAINYSINKVEDKGSIKTQEEIHSSLEKVIALDFPIDEIVHGHDLSELTYILIRKHLKINNDMVNSGDNIEKLWAMSYDSMYFKKSELYTKIDDFTKQKDLGILLV
ncbi:hypothetical protein GCE9029_04124 [Grimontia celer]|uniref:Uncharacterized protein n=1 Tax=Grimontia celer TaxID=1796497 RepID=A0A128FBV8_9GAMM|nr:DUF4435 domain-containing protein [Grimontia celer]CZF83985.1 hypothetical protein GCE9029_04124 [Grimontia celer]